MFRNDTILQGMAPSTHRLNKSVRSTYHVTNGDTFLHRQRTRLVLNENQHIFLLARHSIHIHQ